MYNERCGIDKYRPWYHPDTPIIVRPAEYFQNTMEKCIYVTADSHGTRSSVTVKWFSH